MKTQIVLNDEESKNTHKLNEPNSRVNLNDLLNRKKIEEKTRKKNIIIYVIIFFLLSITFLILKY